MLSRVGLLGLGLVCCLPALSKAQQYYFTQSAGCTDCGQVQAACDCETSATGTAWQSAGSVGVASSPYMTSPAYGAAQSYAPQYTYAPAAQTAASSGFTYQTAALPSYAMTQQYVSVPQTMVPVVTQQPSYQVQYQQQPYVQQTPVTTYRNVTVDQGSYQMVWVPKPVTQQVPQTTMQSQVNYRTVAVPVASTQNQVAYAPATPTYAAQSYATQSAQSYATPSYATQTYAAPTYASVPSYSTGSIAMQSSQPIYAAQAPTNVFAESYDSYSTATLPSTSVPMIAADPGTYSSVVSDYGTPLFQADPAHTTEQPIMSLGTPMSAPSHSILPTPDTTMTVPSYDPLPNVSSSVPTITGSVSQYAEHPQPSYSHGSVPHVSQYPAMVGNPSLVPSTPSLQPQTTSRYDRTPPAYEPSTSRYEQDYVPSPQRRRSAKGLFTPVRSKSSARRARFSR